MIYLKNITIKIEDRVLLEKEELKLYPGQVHSIIGKSGIGKTSLLYELALLTNNTSLEYYWNNEKVHCYNDVQKSHLRRCNIGFMLQDLQLINEQLSLYDNLRCVCALSGKDFNQNKLNEYLNDLKLSINLDNYAHQLSRGEKQRFSLLMILIKDPSLIICDEPTSALDNNNSKIFMDVLNQIAKKYQKTVVIVTHDRNIVKKSDYVYKIENKHIHVEKIGKINNINNSIVNPVVIKTFFQTYNKTTSISSKKMIHFIYILLMLFVCISPLLIQININKYKDITELYSYNEIIVTNTSKQMPGVTYNGICDVFEEDEIRLMEYIDNVDKIDNYYEFTAYINSKEVHVMTKNNITSTKVSKGLYEYIKENEIINLNIIINKKSFEIPYTLSSYELNENIKGSIDEEYMYIPFKEIEDILKKEGIVTSGSLLVSCENDDFIDETSTEIQRWFPKASVFVSGQNEREYLKQLNIVNENLKIINIVITVCIIIFSIILQISDYKNRKRELCMLRLNGLNKFHLFLLIFYENMKILTINLCICLLLTFLIVYLNFQSLNFNLLINACFDILIFILITKIIPWFISIHIFVKKNNIISVLRD